MEYSHYETKKLVVVAVYGGEEPRKQLAVFLEPQGRVLHIGEIRIELFQKVKGIRRMSADAFKTEIELEKEFIGKWNCLSRGQAATGAYSPQKFGQKLVEEEKDTGQKTLMALLEQIYEDGDDSTRMAMNKSFLESKGAVLSTKLAELPDTHTDHK